MRWRLRMFAKSEGLTNSILGFIIVNTIFMMMDFQCDFCADAGPYTVSYSIHGCAGID